MPADTAEGPADTVAEADTAVVAAGTAAEDTDLPAEQEPADHPDSAEDS